MQHDLKELLDLLEIVLKYNDGCTYCKHYKMDELQCFDCRYQDACPNYDYYELDLDKVKEDYLRRFKHSCYQSKCLL